MKIFKNKQALKAYLSELKAENNTIGFVPTMGALHSGHLSLVKEAKKDNDIVVVSIFINPTQFDNQEDLNNYPITLEKDKDALNSVFCDVLFLPSVSEMYHQNVVPKKFDFDGLEYLMEGAFRKNHFDGVATIVKTLFEITIPTNAYFGKKDFQQLQIIKRLVEKEQLPVNVIGCEILRESDGLAMSSRNTRLTDRHRKAAPFIYQTLQKAALLFKEKTPQEIIDWVHLEFNKEPLLDLEYFSIADRATLSPILQKKSTVQYSAFIAVFAGKVRLIDNIELHH